MENNQNNPIQNNGQQAPYQQPQQYQQPQYQQPVYQQPQYQPAPQPMYQQPQYQPVSANACPKCGREMKSKFRGWQIAVAIIFFPIGLLALAAGKQKKCPNCGHVVD